MKEKLIKKAILEIENPTFGTTEQYLEVLDLEIEDRKLKIERVDLASFEEDNVVYFAIKDEPFFLCVYFSKKDNEITYVGTENGKSGLFNGNFRRSDFSSTFSIHQLERPFWMECK
ncbi:hypothetical protein [Zunongwangia pacifica]|uniref:Uncharacterized protein n=1 Tax=Zunongwangia pacifica TaxID=2911062 RepID=A0A9X2CLU3_9FLAO|nr:hypothetical protein [Zunongwangia pacifica]MCL6220411.1 hypothetical protein [Zunongwangia pacifica]